MTNRAYCFTSFQESVLYKEDVHRYLVIGVEVCPESGRRHLQCYCELFKPMRVKAFQKSIGDPTAHCEKRRGTREEARDYCMKDGNYVEHGIWDGGGQGQRNDLKAIITECKDIEQVMDEHPEDYCRYRKGLQDIYFRKMEKDLPDWRKVEVEVLYGETGCGKTYTAIKENPVYFKLNTNTNSVLWFDGYKGEPCLILDDFYGWIKYGDLLEICDGYKYRCNLKGSHTWARWSKVVITSNSLPADWYKSISSMQLAALKRRVTRLRVFHEPVKIVDEEKEQIIVSDSEHELANKFVSTQVVENPKDEMVEIKDYAENMNIDIAATPTPPAPDLVDVSGKPRFSDAELREVFADLL